MKKNKKLTSMLKILIDKAITSLYVLVSLAAVFLGCHATLRVTAQKTAARETMYVFDTRNLASHLRGLSTVSSSRYEHLTKRPILLTTVVLIAL